MQAGPLPEFSRVYARCYGLEVAVAGVSCFRPDSVAVQAPSTPIGTLVALRFFLV